MIIQLVQEEGCVLQRYREMKEDIESFPGAMAVAVVEVLKTSRPLDLLSALFSLSYVR